MLDAGSFPVAEHINAKQKSGLHLALEELSGSSGTREDFPDTLGLGQLFLHLVHVQHGLTHGHGIDGRALLISVQKTSLYLLRGCRLPMWL